MTKLIYGVGYNSKLDDDKCDWSNRSAAYRTWLDMLRRCYCVKNQKLKPTYKNCSVDSDWHDFQVFAKWFHEQEYSCMGYHLDKDLILEGNEVYAAELCCFIPQELNKLIMFRRVNRGCENHGAYFEKQSGKYKAQLSIGSKRLTLGRFDSPSEAHKAYKEAKESHVRSKAVEWQDRVSKDVFKALVNWKLVV